jgi:hypothetical protein
MADTGVVDLNADFVRLGWRNFDILNGEVLAGLPGDCGLCSCQPRLFHTLRSCRHFDRCSLQMNSHPCGLAHGLRVQVAGPHAKASVGRNMEWELERRALLRADNG